MRNLVLPPRAGGGANESLQDVHSVVVIGANGSGKSRLGYWIEMNQPDPVRTHRVSAQRMLTFGEYIQPTEFDRAQRALMYGHEVREQRNKQDRWGSRPVTRELNDFDILLRTLLAHEAKRDREYRIRLEETKEFEQAPETHTDVLRRIWRKCMPQRELKFEGRSVKASTAAGEAYTGMEMSDGERVTLYLVGQCLCAPQEGVIIVDEPEIHLHKSILTILWDEVEAARDDCLFVYITHDPGFAITRAGARKIWVKEFHGGNRWNWEEVGPAEGLPEDLSLRLLGSRLPVLFVEGEERSLDAAVYRAVYPGWLVIPCGSCEAVIRNTKALRAMPQLHRLAVCGLVDRDSRAPEELARLEQCSIFAAEVAEVENLLCVEPVLGIAADYLQLPVDETVSTIRAFVLDEFTKELDNQAAIRATTEVKHGLSRFDSKAETPEAMTEDLQAYLGELRVEEAYSKHRNHCEAIQTGQSYTGVLRTFRRKSICARVSRFFGLQQDEYARLILRLLSSAGGPRIAEALRQYLPRLPDPNGLLQREAAGPDQGPAAAD